MILLFYHLLVDFGLTAKAGIVISSVDSTNFIIQQADFRLGNGSGEVCTLYFLFI